MRYTCNKKAFPQFLKDCKNCSEYNPCAKGGKWCFIGAMENEHIVPDASTSAMQNAAAPLLVKHDYRDVKIAKNTVVTIDLEDIKKQMEKELYKDLYIGLSPLA